MKKILVSILSLLVGSSLLFVSCANGNSDSTDSTDSTASTASSTYTYALKDYSGTVEGTTNTKWSTDCGFVSLTNQVTMAAGDLLILQLDVDFGSDKLYKAFYFQACTAVSPVIGEQFFNETGFSGHQSFYIIYNASEAISFSTIQLTLNGKLDKLTAQNFTINDFDVAYIPSANKNVATPTLYSSSGATDVVINNTFEDNATVHNSDKMTLSCTQSVTVGEVVKISIVIPSGTDLTNVAQLVAETNVDDWGWHGNGWTNGGIGKLTTDKTFEFNVVATKKVAANGFEYFAGVQMTGTTSTFATLPVSSMVITKYPKL